MSQKYNLFLYTFILLVAFSCGRKQQPKTIYLVRHAEKQLVGDDPELSVAGTVRAKKLAQLMTDKEIRHVFSTNTIRTKATVQRVADHAEVEVEIYDQRAHDDLVGELRHRKGNVLVVGHSNTIHHVANYFVGATDKYSELEDIEYDFIFIVTMDRNGSSVERVLYKEFDQ